MLVATVAIVGRIADAVGRKLLYVYGFGVFTAGSALCGLAPTLGVLIAARVLQALGAAMLQANSVALITDATPRPQLGRAIGIQGTAQALGLALGPAVGGALMAIGGWRLIFLVNIPAGAVGLVLGWLLLPRSRSWRPIGKQDRLGAVLLAIAAAGPMAYLSLAGHEGYANPVLLLALGAGIAAEVAFVRRERRLEDPLIDLTLFARPALRVGLSTGLISYLVLFGTLFVVPYYLTAAHTGAAQIGLELSALPIALGIAAPIAGRLLNDSRERLLTGGGMLLTAAGLLLIAIRHDTAGLLTGLALAGLGLGAFTPANNATIMGASPSGHTGAVGGVLNMTRGFGTALGVALGGALFIAGSEGGHAAGSTGSAGRGLAVAAAALACLAILVGVGLLVRRGRPRLTRRSPRQMRPRRSRASESEPAEGWRRAAALAPVPLAVDAGHRWDPSALLVLLGIVILGLLAWARAVPAGRARGSFPSTARRALLLALDGALCVALVLLGIAIAARF